MTGEDCVTYVKTLLDNDATLKGYLRKTFAGVRSNISESSFPCVVIEPEREDEVDTFYPCQHITLTLILTILAKDFQVERQLVGDSGTKGIMDMVRDVQKAIASDKTLNSNCLKYSFISVAYDINDFPLRGATLTMSILYETDFTSRT